MKKRERKKLKRLLRKSEKLAENGIGMKRALGEQLEYDPDQSPDAEKWLELSENERLVLIMEYHRKQGLAYGDGPSGEHLHVAFHCIIENQLAMGVPDVQYDLEAMLRKQISRHEAIHQLCRELSVDIFKEMQKRGQ